MNAGVKPAPEWPNWLYLTADVILVAEIDGQPHVLLVRRSPDAAGAPGKWAIPGGFVEAAESCEAAGRRELVEETGVRAPETLQLLGFYPHPERDGGVRIDTVVYIGRLPLVVDPCPGDDAAAAEWVRLDTLDDDQLAFDHAAILRDASDWAAYRQEIARALRTSSTEDWPEGRTGHGDIQIDVDAAATRIMSGVVALPVSAPDGDCYPDTQRLTDDLVDWWHSYAVGGAPWSVTDQPLSMALDEAAREFVEHARAVLMSRP